MSVDYGQRLVIERARSAGGIAAEMVEIYEDALEDVKTASCDEQDNLENKIDDLEESLEEAKGFIQEIIDIHSDLMLMIEMDSFPSDIQEAFKKLQTAIDDATD